jgi:hypothetical protein
MAGAAAMEFNLACGGYFDPFGEPLMSFLFWHSFFPKNID